MAGQDSHPEPAASVNFSPRPRAACFGLALAASIWTLPASAADTGVRTRDAFEEPDARQIQWIDWDSPFRGADLEIGDWIVGTQGRHYQGDRKHRGVGEIDEERFWEELGLGPGDPMTLLVDRQGRVFEVAGELRAGEIYKDAAGQRALSPAGPAAGERDGFRQSWSSWYDDFRKRAEFILGNKLYTAIDTVSEAKRLEESDFAERIAYLEEHYPGPFADAARDDFRRMLEIVGGERRELTAADLEYRRLGELRIAEVAEAADAALPAFAEEIGEELLAEPFPLPDVATADLSPWIGKWVRLPKVGSRELIFESLTHSSYSFFRAGSDRDGWYLVDRLDPAMKSAYFAIARYQDKVSPEIERSDFEFFGQVRETPVLAYDIRTDKLYTGLAVAPMAAMIVDSQDSDRRLFVDLRGAKEEEEEPWDGSQGPAPWTVAPKATELPFAGEAELLTLEAPPVAADAPPEEVLLAFFERLELGNFEAWKELLADWQILTFVGPEPVVVARDVMTENDMARVWNSSRQRLLGEVYGLEIYDVGRVRRVYEGSPIDGSSGRTSEVDEIVLMVMPVGKFGDQYRTYQHGRIHRSWHLQRLDGGPWRVVETRPL